MCHADSLFLAFQKDRDTVMRLEPGAIATVTNTTFERNEAQSLSPTTVPAGPVAGLKDDALSDASAIWFHSCVFKDSNKGALPGMVSVESRECRVYSNTLQPTVWDLELEREVQPWLIAPPEDGSIAPESVFGDLEFPTEADSFFKRIVMEQAAASGLPEVTPAPMPAGNTFITRDPYVGGTRKIDAGVVGGVTSAAVVLLLVAVAVAVLLRRHRNKQRLRGATASSHQVRSLVSMLIALIGTVDTCRCVAGRCRTAVFAVCIYKAAN